MLELRTLRYFLTFVKEGSITAAANAMHITEPTFSRQLSELERKAGKSLYRRINKRIVLTQEGEALFNYADKIIELADLAESEIMNGGESVRGSVFVGGGSTIGMEVIAKAVDLMRREHPEILAEFVYAASSDQIEDLSRGVLDFVVETELKSRPGFETLSFPKPDRWVAFMRKDDPLARKRSVKPSDFVGKNVIVSRNAMRTLYMRNVIDEERTEAITPTVSPDAGILGQWFGEHLGSINVIATQNISLYGMFFVKEALAYAFAYEGLYEIDGLVHKPLKPEIQDANGLIWPKKRPLSEQAGVFLSCVRRVCGIDSVPSESDGAL